MLSELVLELETSKKIDCRKSSVFQSILLEKSGSEYAAKMHEINLRPYSQYIFYNNSTGRVFWNVKTTSEEAFQNLIVPLQDNSFQNMKIEHDDIFVQIINKKLKTLPLSNLFQDFYTKSTDRNIRIRFLTPTAFKQNGQYIIYPDIRLFYQSLMRKCSAVSDKFDFMDEDTLDQLVQYSKIVRYKLKSTNYPMSSVKIPAFIGEIQLKINGPALLCNFVHVLLEMGEYLGVGIKAAMGMGAIEIIDRRDEHDRTRS